MNERQELLVENLIAQQALLLSTVEQDRKLRASIDARLERIERSLALPLVYSGAQVGRRLGYHPTWAYEHRSELPKPVSLKPLRWSVKDIDAWALERELAPRNAPRRRSA